MGFCGLGTEIELRGQLIVIHKAEGHSNLALGLCLYLFSYFWENDRCSEKYQGDQRKQTFRVT